MKKHANLSIFVPHVGCPHRCTFCNQNNISGAQKAPDAAEVTALCDKFLPADGKNTEIAFFGGSFTAIERGYMRSLLAAAYPFVQNGRAGGIRLSTRPDAIDEEILDILESRGVTAIELGAQSMDDRVLALNRRGHTSDDVRAAAALIKERGFELGLQMMTGLYGEEDTLRSALFTAKELIKLAPHCTRIYPTLVVSGTELETLYRQGKYNPPDLETSVGAVGLLLPLFERAQVRVIRAGLHDDVSLRGSVVAGPYHPAFGELALARAYRNELEEKLNGRKGVFTVAVKKGGRSQAAGQKNENLSYFASQGAALDIVENDALTGLQIQIIGD